MTNTTSKRLAMRARVAPLICAAALSVGGALATIVPASATSFDPAAAEQQLFNDLNQDRAANGLPALVLNSTVGNIARGGSVSVCGQTVHGRSQDMVERNYFSHQIPPCGSYVWPVLSAAGVQYNGAAENIAWNNYSPSTSADQANSQFMSSPDHRANILGSYNQVGIGAWQAPGSWNGGGVAVSGAIIFTEIFIDGPVPAAPTPGPRILVLGGGGPGIPWATSSGAAAAVTTASYGQQLTTSTTSKTTSSMSVPAVSNASGNRLSSPDSSLATAASRLRSVQLVSPIF